MKRFPQGEVSKGNRQSEDKPVKSRGRGVEIPGVLEYSVSMSSVQQAVKGANQTAIATQLNVSRNYINMVMNRKRFPSLPVAVQLARALGVSLDDLVKVYKWDQEPV